MLLIKIISCQLQLKLDLLCYILPYERLLHLDARKWILDLLQSSVQANAVLFGVLLTLIGENDPWHMTTDLQQDIFRTRHMTNTLSHVTLVRFYMSFYQSIIEYLKQVSAHENLPRWFSLQPTKSHIPYGRDILFRLQHWDRYYWDCRQKSFRTCNF